MKTLTDWDNLYLDIAYTLSTRSYAEDKKVGCVIVKDDNIISFSYNGTARGTDNDTQNNPVLHAEAHAIAKAAKQGTSVKGATQYTTLSPCIECAKLIQAAGIKRVVYDMEYKCLDGLDYLRKTNVQVNSEALHVSLFNPEDLRHTGLL